MTEELPPGQAFGIQDVAADLVDKLVRRHPHVFAGAEAGSAEELNETWERQKVDEKSRTSAVDGVPIDQPALALAAKLVSRARRAGLAVPAQEGADIGSRLLALAAEAVDADVDPESALRRAARHYRAALLAEESRQTGT
jgi:XTP/dITP diphosphohydrolase